MAGPIKMQLVVEVCDCTVTLEVRLGDPYAAQVYYDDIIERLQSGDGILLTLKAPAGSGTVLNEGEQP